MKSIARGLMCATLLSFGSAAVGTAADIQTNRAPSVSVGEQKSMLPMKGVQAQPPATPPAAPVQPATPALLRLTSDVNLQRQQIAALTPNLGTCAIARRLADEINREAASLVQTLNSASRRPLKTTGKRDPEELRSITKLKNHEEHLRGLEIRLTSLEPCPQTEAEKSSRLKAARLEKVRKKQNDMEVQSNELQQKADKADEHKKTAQDHKKTIKDAVRKMLEQIAEINRATNL